MAAGTYNFTIEQGTTFSREIVWKDDQDNPIDVTGYTARMQIRSSVADATVLLELTSENGRITVGTTDGKFTLSITDADTTAITWASGVYDLEVIDGSSDVTRLLKGTITVDKEVTR